MKRRSLALKARCQREYLDSEKKIHKIYDKRNSIQDYYQLPSCGSRVLNPLFERFDLEQEGKKLFSRASDEIPTK